MRCLALLVFVALHATASHAAALRHEVLDRMDAPSSWKASASEQVSAALRRDADGSLCLDYDFGRVSGYAVMRRELPVQWPAHFELVTRLKGAGATNDLQFKLVDASGDNVWWMNRPDRALPARLTPVKIRRRHIEFAWGPTSDRALKSTQYVEFVIAAGRRGGKGSLCVGGLTLLEREPPPAVWPEPRIDRGRHGVDVDFRVAREFNGLALQWPSGRRSIDYDVLASDDGRRWRLLRRVRGSDGGLDAIWLPEQETRHLRIRGPGSDAPVKVELRSAAQWPTFNAVLAALAAQAPRGDVPRAFVGEQNYWTLVGVDGGGDHSALLSEDGAIEVGRGGWSVEPSVRLDDGTRLTWAQVSMTHGLRGNALPVAGVHWKHADVALDIEAAADGPSEGPRLLARYALRNTGLRARTLVLSLAVRPWQVNPPQQFLSTQGGASPIRTLRYGAGVLQVNGATALQFTQPPHRVAALAFDGGASLAALETAPPLSELVDSQAHASAVVEFNLTLAPGAMAVVGWASPLAPGEARPAGLSAALLENRIDAATQQWQRRLGRVGFDVPSSAQHIVDTLRTSLAHILMSRQGPALRPGTRSYARSWIRDGAMMVAGLVRLGETEVAREFVDWFGGHLFKSGMVPCCVDERGAGAVAENDSHGQYLYAVAEVWRHTQDRGFLERHWPNVQRVMNWMETLRQSERTAANRGTQRERYFGLMPPSISHEGYSDKAAYSYWDDFWSLRGYKDAVAVAQAMGQGTRAAAWAAWRDEFESELSASIEATARHYGIDVIAGAADRGDFDATSTTIALNPAQAKVPRRLLAKTFERYWQEMSARSEGRRAWKDYTPYELRTVGALVRLGQPEQAHAMLDFFFRHQRPEGWNQWAEVVLPDQREPRFLGDMPHAWVSSDYIRSALDLFAYEREADASLVVGAGLKAEWLRQGDIELRGLSTAHGEFDFVLARTSGGWKLSTPRVLSGLRGGVRLVWPASMPRPRALHEGRELPWGAEGELRLPDGPATIELLAQEVRNP